MRGAGRVVFAAILLLIVGTLNIIYGFGALDDANIFVNDTRYILDNLNTLGWTLIILGVIQLTGGFSLMAGNAYGRVDRDHRRQPRRDRRPAVDRAGPPVVVAGDLRPLRLRRPRNHRLRRRREEAGSLISAAAGDGVSPLPAAPPTGPGQGRSWDTPSVTVIKDTGERALLPPFTEEHEELRESIGRFVAKEILPHVDEWEEAREFPRELYPRCGELGFLGLKYPEELGGQGGDYIHDAVWTEQLALLGRRRRRRRGARRPHRHRHPADLQVRHPGAAPALPGARRSRARGSAPSGSPSRAPAPTSPRSGPPPARSTAATSSTAPRPSSPTASAPTSSSAPSRPPRRAATTASPSWCWSARCPATRSSRSWRRWAGTHPTPASSPSPTSRCPRRTCSARRTTAST